MKWEILTRQYFKFQSIILWVIMWLQTCNNMEIIIIFLTNIIYYWLKKLWIWISWQSFYYFYSYLWNINSFYVYLRPSASAASLAFFCLIPNSLTKYKKRKIIISTPNTMEKEYFHILIPYIKMVSIATTVGVNRNRNWLHFSKLIIIDYNCQIEM